LGINPRKMKKIFYLFALLALSLSLNAQNYVLDFDGDDHVAVDTTFSFANLTQLTYSMWVKSDWRGANYLVDFTDDPAGYANPDGGFRTFIGRFNGNFIFSQYYRGANTNNVLDIDSKAGEYVHIACVIRRSAVNGTNFDYDLITYLNGVEQDRDVLEVSGRTTTESFLRLNNVGPKMLGSRFNLRNNNFLSGQMDDFAVYNIALSEAEIKDIACTGVTPITNRTILHYNFNEGSGFTSHDSSGSAYDGQNNQPFFQQDNLPNLGNVNPVADFDVNSFNNSYFIRVQNQSDDADLNVWDFGDGTVDTNNNNVFFYRYESSDTFNICLDVSGSCGGSDQFCQDVIVNCPFPTADFEYIYQDLSFAGSVDTANVDSISWDFGDGTTSGAASVLHKYRFDGKKTICVYVYNNCGVDSICKSFDAVFSSVSELGQNDQSISIKTLANQQVELEVSEAMDKLDYRVYDLKGSLILSGAHEGSSKHTFSVPQSGLYLIDVNSGQARKSQKIMIR